MNSEPWPPPSSLLEPPPALKQLFMHAIVGECGGGGGDAVRTPQSTQSVPYAQIRNISELGLPLSQSAKKEVFVQMSGGGLGAGGDMGGLDVGGGLMGRTPLQLAQSVPYW